MALLNFSLFSLLNPIPLSIIVFGAIIGFLDFKHVQINNIYIFLLLVIGLSLNVLFSGTLSNPSLEINSVFFQTVISILISFFIGFLLYFTNVWSASDAKLFTALTLLLPVTTCMYGCVNFLSSVTILINSFVPAAIFYLLLSLAKTDFKTIKKLAKRTLSYQKILNTIIFSFGFSALLQIFFDYINFYPSIYVEILILFVSMEIINKVLSFSKFVYLVLAIVIAVFSFSSVFTLTFLYSLFLFIISLVTLKFLVYYISNLSFDKNVKINDLKPRMILAYGISKVDITKRYSSIQKIIYLIKSQKSITGDIHLTKEKINELKKLRREGKIKFDTVKIKDSSPFSSFLFLGALITFFVSGSIFYYLYFLL